MRINLYALQRHTQTGETREQLIDTQYWAEIHTGDQIEANGKTFVVSTIRTTAKRLTLDVVCLEGTADNKKNNDTTR